MKKAYSVPVSKAVMKMLKRDYKYQTHLKVDNWVYGKCIGHHANWKAYLDNPKEDMVSITLVSDYASKGRLYTIARLFQYEFFKKLLYYVEAQTEAKIPASKAIHKFFEKYDLTEEDLKFSTAYKRWQRYQEEESKASLIPLW